MVGCPSVESDPDAVEADPRPLPTVSLMPIVRSASAVKARRSYRLIAIDLDGTLVDGQNNMSEAVERAVQEARARGVEVVLVSGRPRIAVLPIFRKLGLVLPVISSGGAHVSDPTSGRMIDEVLPPSPDLAVLVRLARSAGLTMVFEGSDALYCEGSAIVREVMQTALQQPIESVEDGLLACAEPIQLTACGPRAQLDRLEAEIGTRALALSAVLAGSEYLEVTAQGVSKGAALELVAQYLGVSLTEIAVIGNGHNDISMFRAAGLAIAMGDAAPEVQAAADVVAPTIGEDGVAWALRQMVLGR